MEVIGQFNLGFIIARLNDDLYLLDQHACDEKYRFETLQSSTTIHRQQLLQPLLLEASPSDEAVIESNLGIFEANGFGIVIDESASPGNRIKLTALPYVKSTQFNQQDVLELASMLSACNAEETSKLIVKNQGQSVMLPKLMSMYASRACRSAVMIGKALSHSEMRSIVKNLGTIEQPWNCPHGRPTMRHLEDMKNVKRRKLMRAQELIHSVMQSEIR